MPLLVLLLGGCQDDAEAPARGGARAPTPVVAESLVYRAIRTRLEAVGTARALHSVSLFPEAAGEVAAVHFQPGDRVEAGELLLELDSRDERLALELAELQYRDAQRLLDRYTSANSGAERTVPETTVDTARTAAETARIERDRARVSYERRFVRAPFDGYVGITDIDRGDRVETTTEITTIDDRSVLLVSFEVPETFVGRVGVGDPVSIETWSAERSRAEGVVVDLGSRVDPLSRAFTARAEVPNNEDRLRPGMSFRVRLDLTGEQYPAVAEVALQWGADGAYIWVVADGRARRVDVRLVQRQEDRVLIEGELPAETQVVAEGMQSMREGLAVRALDAAALALDPREVLSRVAAEG